jgi:magnesium-transporting ATPase (P-type)
MARRRAVIRRLPAVETLGSTTVICSDKTGTLTRNEMTVEALWAAGATWEFDEDGGEPTSDDEVTDDVLRRVLTTGMLTNEAVLGAGEDGGNTGDPTEIALLVSAQRAGMDVAELREAHPIVAERPFDPVVLYSMAACEHDGDTVLHLKGATETLLERCSSMLGPDGEVALDTDAIHGAMEAMAERGLRVLAMAAGPLPHRPEAGADIEVPDDLVFLGLQGMMDPPREGVEDAVRECGEAGIRVVMVTGDHAKTASAIARDLGLGDGEAQVLTGREIEAMSDDELRDQVMDVHVFARTTPEHKLRVVRAFQSHDEVVTVTGDGVNDAPALKAAEIGVAMGKSGTDVAREASEMVLTDDAFVSIRHAVEEGRMTFDVVRQVTFFLVSTGAGAVLAILGGIGLGWALPLLPAQILWLNVVTNGFQDVALAFERSTEDRLHREQRGLHEGLLSRTLWERTALIAVLMAGTTLALFRWSETNGGEDQARAVALTSLVVLSAVLVYGARSEHRGVWRLNPLHNPFLLVAQAGALAVHVAALHTPFLQDVLRVAPIDGRTWLAIIGAAVVVLVISELHKWWRAPDHSST